MTQSIGGRALGNLQQGAFKPLQQGAYQGLQQGASLKGLLKPFKGKGELDQLAEQCTALEAGLRALVHEVLAQVREHPFALLPVRLIEQNTSAGTTFLRWQSVQDRRMGFGVWAAMVQHPKTPANLLQDLLALEQHRITLNMQISLVHFIGKQAAECATKMGQAEAEYQARLQQLTHHQKPSQSERPA
ncbi:DUF3158 family protein [Pseudomonas sp. MPFS]|uniref:DUF3158 family protein n=1 Tax=Pseudomonas sp. MPFS TaxID=2795724 RepID=UPI001F14083F|nr:DUF3158 family protein [Pseudomonas sp. MPFS]UMZ10624.1 DUF3158 family protein [Pseudomonas sp. MPFS]